MNEETKTTNEFVDVETGEVHDSTGEEIVVSGAALVRADVAPVVTLSEAKERFDQIRAYVKECLVEGQDFGRVPGVPKPALFKAGAEKVCAFLGLSSTFACEDKVEDWTGAEHGGEPFFSYRYSCTITRGDRFVVKVDGSINSWEDKYRWRKNKQTGEREKNDRIFDQVNTLVKMAEKRAYVAATLIATGMSELFTQDIEETQGKTPYPKKAVMENAAQSESWEGVLEEAVEATKGKSKAGRDYTRYSVTLPDGKVLQTLDKDKANVCEVRRREGKSVFLEYQYDKQWNQYNLIGVA